MGRHSSGSDGRRIGQAGIRPYVGLEGKLRKLLVEKPHMAPKSGIFERVVSRRVAINQYQESVFSRGRNARRLKKPNLNV